MQQHCIHSLSYFILCTFQFWKPVSFLFLHISVNSHLDQSKTAAYTHNNFTFKYFECKHLCMFKRGDVLQFSDLRKSRMEEQPQGLQQLQNRMEDNEKDNEEGENNKQMEEDNEVGERQNSHFYRHRYTHTCHQVCVKQCQAGNSWAGVTCPPILSPYASLLLDSALRQGVKCAVTCVQEAG